MSGLDGIALMNVISNPDEASITGSKKLQTRITHNDGGCHIKWHYEYLTVLTQIRWSMEASPSSHS